MDPRVKLLEKINHSTSRIEYLSQPIVLLCGGQVKEKEHPSDPTPPIHSLRHAITRTTTSFEIFRPEEITNWQADGVYKNLVDFENDLAGICSIVVIILESPGAIAELGAFSQLSDITKKLIVINADQFIDDDSFIELGILRYIREIDNRKVKTYPWNISVPPNYPSIPTEVIDDLILDIESELARQSKSETLKEENNSHIMALICELINIFSALKAGEILSYLESFNVFIKNDELRRKLFLLEKFHLVKKSHYSDSVFYQIGKNSYHKIRMGLKGGKHNDSLRTRLECLEFYKTSDKDKHRVRAIKANSDEVEK